MVRRPHILAGFLTLTALVLALWGGPTHPAHADQPTLQGVAYALQSQVGGLAVVSLQVNGDDVTGVINLSPFPDGGVVLCGAGPFVASRASMPFRLGFVSRDNDAGCGADWDAVYTGTATLDREDGHLWGELRIVNAGRSRLRPERVRYEAWSPGAGPPLVGYRGTFRNATREREGVLTLRLREGTQLVEGSADFDGLPGEPLLCGGGSFAGLVGDTLQLTLVGRDPDPGCVSESAIQLTLAPSADGDGLVGTFSTGAESGTFTVARATLEPEPAPAAPVPPPAPADMLTWLGRVAALPAEVFGLTLIGVLALMGLAALAARRARRRALARAERRARRRAPSPDSLTPSGGRRSEDPVVRDEPWPAPAALARDEGAGRGWSGEPARLAAPPPSSPLSQGVRWACGQCRGDVPGDAKVCPHCNARLEL